MTLRCRLGLHDRVLRYERDGVLLHYLAVCSRCGHAKPATPADPQQPTVVRIPTRRERREMQRRARRGEQDAHALLKRIGRPPS